MSVNFMKNQEEITKSWRAVVDNNSVSNWALYGYEGTTNVIRLISSGSKGLDELVSEFNCSLIQYAFCRVIDTEIGLNKLVLINWQGESAPLSRKGLCASHVSDVANYFKGCTQTITIRNDDEATREHLMEQIMKTSASKINLNRQCQPSGNSSIVTTNGDHTSVKNSSSSNGQQRIVVDIAAADRKSFWQRQEEEEKERVAEEKRRAAEKQAQFERERKLREENEAKKLAETIEQRDRLIDATRQADRKAATSSSSTNSSGVSSQPSSIVSSTSQAEHYDSAVGRRSELIRLERNQETQSLISKGLIKNKRAIFEQQAQAAKDQQQPTLTRRASGAMVTQRLNAFKSLDLSSTSSTNMDDTATSPQVTNVKGVVNRLANGLASKVNVSDDDEDDVSMSNCSTKKNQVVSPIKREIETINLTNIEKDQDTTTSNVSYASNGSSNNNMSSVESNNDATDVVVVEKMKQSSIERNGFNDNSPKLIDASDRQAAAKTNSTTNIIPNNVTTTTDSNSKNSTMNDSNEAKQLQQQQPQQQSTKLDDTNETESHDKSAHIEFLNGQKYCEAIALFDYQAADNSEISFDPNDKIGFIQKVDPGWWQGKVISGRYEGLIGLFPSNYVKEL